MDGGGVNRCKSEYRCRKLDIQPDGTKLPCITDQPFCEGCVGLLSDRIVGSLLEDFDALHVLLGEKQMTAADKIKYTRNPAIPLAVEPERLMTELVFFADLAAVMVSDLLELEYPPAEPVKHDEHGRELESIGDRQTRYRRQATVIDTAFKRLHPHLEKLFDADPQPVVMWFSGEAIDVTPTAWEKSEPGKYIPVDGQGRRILSGGKVLEDWSGVAVALKLWELHDLVRGMFGARAKDQKDNMASPCPFYSDYHPSNKRTLFRRHGEDIIYCSKCPKGKGKQGWTHDEYRNLEFQVGVMFSEEDAVQQAEFDRVLAEERSLREAAEAALQTATEQLERVGKIADLSPEDAEQFDVPTFQRYLGEILHAC